MSFKTNPNCTPVVGSHNLELHPLTLCFTVEGGGHQTGEFLDIKITKAQAETLRDILTQRLETFNVSEGLWIR